jgi:hypothetical protein
LREYRYHQDAATGSIRADEEADMYELCDLDVKAAPFARRHLLKLTATAAARLVLAPHWPAAPVGRSSAPCSSRKTAHSTSPAAGPRPVRRNAPPPIAECRHSRPRATPGARAPWDKPACYRSSVGASQPSNEVTHKQHSIVRSRGHHTKASEVPGSQKYQLF